MTAGNGAEEVFTVLDGLARLAVYGETGMDRADNLRNYWRQKSEHSEPKA
jgi:hypothetical protein